MKVLLFGATGMVGQGVLRECLLDPTVELVQTIGRSSTGVVHPKLREIVQPDLFHYEGLEESLSGFDACFFCLGVSSVGMKAEAYERVTYGLTLAAAGFLAPRNPNMTFIYVTGVGTDSSEQGRTRWARVKGRTENALLRLPFRAAYMFRPGAIEALHGVRPRPRMNRFVYGILKPFFPLLRAVMPNSVLTTEEIGRAMLLVAERGAPKKVLEPRDIHEVLRAASAQAADSVH